MTLRTRLTATLFLLAVVPLTGTTVYSYVSSRNAYENLVAAEVADLAGELPGRMRRVTDDLDHRIAQLWDVPFEALRPSPPRKGAMDHPQEVYRRLEHALGPLTELVESFEFTPVVQASAGEIPSPHLPVSPAPPEVRGPDKVMFAKEPAANSQPAAPSYQWTLRQISSPQEAEAFRRQIEAAVSATRRQTLALAANAQAASEAVETARRRGAPRAEGAREEQGRRPDAGPEKGQAAFNLHRKFACTAMKAGKPTGRLEAHVIPGRILSHALAGARHRQDEVAFAVDAQGELHVAETDRGRLDPIAAVIKTAPRPSAGTRLAAGDWILAMNSDAPSGLTWGVARPIDTALRQIRTTAAWNFLIGLAVVSVALIGIVPLSRRLTRDLAVLAAGAERLGKGDFGARVTVRSRDEIGRLAVTFNRMAEDLRAHEEQLVVQERLRRELELCRRIQEEMLPKAALRFSFAEAHGISIPASEVGGDFFNYFALPGGEVALVVGDVSGKGVPAALLMAQVQATLRARLPITPDLARLAAELDRELEARTPRPTYLTLFAAILDGERRLLRYVNAGQNPPILVRRGGASERLEATGRPLALLAGGTYEERSTQVNDGDALVLYTDGVVECENVDHEPFSLARLESILAECGDAPAGDILVRIDEAVRAHRAGTEPPDDATVVVLRVGPAGSA